jgi:glycosyltransferase involved in cell wall biosynthesis
MNVAFFIPPPAQRIGGLEAAIESLRTALERRGVPVTNDLNGAHTVAHFHGLWQRPFARLAADCRARNIPYVVSPHGMLEPWAWRHKWWKKWPYFQLVEKGMLNGADLVVATAAAEARRLQAFLPRQRIEAVPLGLTGDARPEYENARRQLGWAPHERVLLFLSRIHVKKGLNLLLEALASMPHPEHLRLVVVGEGAKDYVRGLHHFADKHAAELPRIDWQGAVWGYERWPYFQGADLFCLPTHSENFGLAVLEACQVGTPVLTTTGTPWADDLGNGRGYISEPSVESIRDALQIYFSRPILEASARQALSDWAWSTFNWDVLSDQYSSIYRRLLTSTEKHG